MAKKSSKNGVVELSRAVRDVLPADYLFKIESFSTVVEENIEKLESDDFEVGDYTWRLRMYPSGNKNENGSEHISLYLAIKGTDKLPSRWELNVHFKLFVYNHIEDNYLTVQDAGAKPRRFHAMKTEWGFSKLLSLEEFNDASNGYLFQHSCIFGVEILVIQNSGLRECISWIKEPENKCFTWEVDSFSAITSPDIFSEEFNVGEQKWQLWLSPNGDENSKGEWLSLFLCFVNPSTSSIKHKVYARFKMRIKDQISDNHCEMECSNWFSSTDEN